MPIKHAIWTVGDKPTPLPVTRLATEQVLEDMIERDPRILSEQKKGSFRIFLYFLNSAGEVA